MNLRAIVILLSFLSLLGLCARASASDTVQEAYNRIARELLLSLPKNGTVAVAPFKDQQGGIPNDILTSIQVSLTAALQRESGFEIDIVARDKLQDIWSEAKDFGDQKFEDLVRSLSADVIIVGEVRAKESGIELSYRAYAAKGSEAGKLMASTPPVSIPLDWKTETGVSPKDAADAVAEMLEAVKRLGSNGGLVDNPKAPAEFYHNARMLAQRGEADLALGNYERLFEFKLPVVDPVYDVISILRGLYGEDGARIYVDKKLSPKLSPEMALLAKQILDDEPRIDVEDYILDQYNMETGWIEDKNLFAPLLAQYMITALHSRSGKMTMGERASYNGSYAVVDGAFKSGAFNKFYFDQINAEKTAKVALDGSAQMKDLYSGNVSMTDNGSAVADIAIFDEIDESRPVTLCIKQLHVDSVCKDYDWLPVVKMKNNTGEIYESLIYIDPAFYRKTVWNPDFSKLKRMVSEISIKREMCIEKVGFWSKSGQKFFAWNFDLLQFNNRNYGEANCKN